MRLLNRSAPGYCGATMDREVNDCTTDEMGSWGLKAAEARNWAVAQSVCVSHCLSCERCRFVTVSLKHTDCSWYAHCNLKRLKGSADFLSVRVRSGWLHNIPRPEYRGSRLYEPPRLESNRPSSCNIYVHDPGSRFNTQPMALPDQRWGDTDHNWHVAYWVHRALSTYAHHVHDPRKADVIFIAHYFLTDNPKSRPLDFFDPLLGWDKILKDGGPEALFLNDTALLKRWEERPADFVAAPILSACMRARGFLHNARWFLTEPYFGNTCGYRYHFDIMAPQVVSSNVWAPSDQDALVPKLRFLTYVGRIGKTYHEPPMSMLRYHMWVALRAHPNVTFLATDYDTSVAPYFQDPLKPCSNKCRVSCKRCLDPRIGLNPTLGVLPRQTSKTAYRSWLTGSTLCLVLRGDNENTRKFTEVILAGCIPVLIADMPAWPYDRHLDYRRFSYEFDWRQASKEPEAVVDYLLNRPVSEIAAKYAELLRVRQRFFYHGNASIEGATKRLILDMCDKPSGKPVGPEQNYLPYVYRSRPKDSAMLSERAKVKPGHSSHGSGMVPGSGNYSANMPVHAGYCEVTIAGGVDCAFGTKGSWELQVNETRTPEVALDSCMQRCRACSRCNYVSVSRRFGDCSWFSRCNVSDLRSLPRSFRTIQVKSKAAHEPDFLDRCAQSQADSHGNYTSRQRILVVRLGGGLGNQVLALLSSIVLACLTSRILYIEDRIHDQLLTSAFAPAWEGSRSYMTPHFEYHPHGSVCARCRDFFGTKAFRLHPVNLAAVGDWRAHSRLVCERDVSSFARIHVTSDGYFLKGLLVNPWHRTMMQQACPDPHACFARIFSLFIRPRPPVLYALQSLPKGRCRLGMHARSANTIASGGAQTGVPRMLQCAKQLLAAKTRDESADFVWLASSQEELRLQLTDGLRRMNATVRTLDTSHALPRPDDLVDWRQPIFTYTSAMMQTAAVDMLALSRCDTLIGTRHSTYTYVAQAISSRSQARIWDEEDHVGDLTPRPCTLFNFTQPVYHAWHRYRKVSQSASCRTTLRGANETWYDAVFEAESSLPVMSQ